MLIREYRTLARVLALPLLFATIPAAFAGPEEEQAADPSPEAAAQEFFALKRAPIGQTAVPSERYAAARKRMEKMAVYSTASGTFKPRTGEVGALSPNLGTWTSLGPGNVGGRTRAILIDPTPPGNTWYAAGVAGGVFKTINSGAAWAPVGDSLANLAVSSLAMSPSDPNTILAGTGEGFFNADAVRGAGIFKSIDGGATWAQVAGTNNANFYYVNDIVWAPSGLVYAATSTGVWKWLDGVFAPVQILVPGLNGGCLDLALSPDFPDDWLLASCGTLTQARVFLTQNGVATVTTGQWDLVLTETDMGRTSLAFGAPFSGVVYAMAANKTTGALHAVWRSTDSGYTWTKGASAASPNFQDRLLLTNPLLDNCQAQTVAQGGYDNVIAVDPNFPLGDVVWAGGIDLFRSTDGGVTFDPVSSWWEVGQPHYVHAHQHAIVFHPTTGEMVIGNDGGIFKKTGGTAGGSFDACPGGGTVTDATYVSLNNGYSVTQFNSGAVFPGDTAYLGGTQGNRTVKGSDGGPNAWVQLDAGTLKLNETEGGGVAVDPGSPNVVFAANTRSSFRRSTDGGASFPANPATSTGAWNSGISDAGFLLRAPLVMDPTDAQRLWTGGSRLWRTNDQAGTWSQASTALATSVSAIAVAPSDPNFALAGTQGGTIYRTAVSLTSTSTTGWTSGTARVGYVSSLAFDPTNSSVAYATYSTFGGIHVYKTTNAGATWTKADGTGVTGIPDIPVHSIAIDPTDELRLYVGTDLGVFVSLNGGSTWAKENSGFASVITEALVVNGANLYAFTHGRGVWRVPLTSATQTTTLDFVITRTTVTEAATVVPLGVTLRTATHAPISAPVTVDYASANGTATAGSDYTAVAGTLTFPSGSAHGATLFIDVPVLQDGFGESAETLTVGLSSPSGGALLGRSTHTITIKDDGDPPGLAIGDVTVSEAATNVTFKVTLAPPALLPVTVNYATADGSAVAGTTGDYTATSGLLTFPPGTTVQNITVPLKADTLAEPAETFFVNLSGPVNAQLTDSQGVATINDNDVSGTVQFGAPTYIVTEAGVKALITVTRTGGMASGVTVPYQTTNGSATAPGDYTTTTGTLTFGTAVASLTFSVPVVNDTLDENDETINLQLLNPGGYGTTLGAQSTAVLTVTDNDAGGELTFSSATYTGVEGNSALITVKRTGGAASNVTVHYATSDGSATSPADYTGTSGDLTFTATDTQKTFSVLLKAESPIEVEGDETLSLALSLPTGGATLGSPNTAVLTIQDASPKVAFTAASVSATETATSLKIGVIRTGPTTTPVSVQYATADGSAKTTAVGGNPADYTGATGTLNFAAGVTAQTITLVLKPDTVVEGPESFTVTLSNPLGGLLGAISTETVNIVDNDFGGVFEFGAATSSAIEPLTAPGSAPAKATITVKRSNGTASGVTVHWATSNGTAVSPADFTAASGTLTFAAGVTSQTFTVYVLPDNDVEGYETFGLALDTPTSGATLGTIANATVTIVDSEPVVQFAAATYTVSEGVGKATVALKRTGSLVGALTVSISDLGGSASYGPGGDYNNLPATLVMPARAATKSFTFDILQDPNVEATESTTLAVTGCTPGCSVGPQVNTLVSIKDDEPVISFSAATYTVGEAAGKVTLTLKRTGSLIAPVDVSLAVAGGGTATAGGVDYNNLPALVTMPANLPTKTFTIDIVNDTLGEANETIPLDITGVAGGYVGTPASTVVTITDNEPAIRFSAVTYTATEPANTTTVPIQLTVTVKRTGVLTQVSSVDYLIAGVSATEGSDYVPTAPTLASGTFNFPVNATQVTFKISILADLTDEPDETIALTLSNAIGAKLGTLASATVTIKDND